MRYQLRHNTFQANNGSTVSAREVVFHPAASNGHGLLDGVTAIYLDVWINEQLYQTDYIYQGTEQYVAQLPLTPDQTNALNNLEAWFIPFLTNLGISYHGDASHSQAVFESDSYFEFRGRQGDAFGNSDNLLSLQWLYALAGESDTDAALIPFDNGSLVPPTEPEEPLMTTPIYGAGLVSAVVVAAALRAQLDEQVGWHKSISNVPVTGVTGISKPLTWDLEDPDTDAGYLNASQITTLIQNQGFRYWGNRNCSADPRFSFEVATRTAQTVLETLVEGCFPFVDQPLTPSLAKDIIDSIQAKLTEFVSTGRLIGASVWYDEAQNSTEGLSQGQMWIDYDYTPVPTLENLGLNQRITDRYLVDFAKLVAQAA